MTIQVGQVISGYENEFGVTLNTISSIEDETVQIDITIYDEDHQQYNWAKQQLLLLEET